MYCIDGTCSLCAAEPGKEGGGKADGALIYENVPRGPCELLCVCIPLV
jgi:hypothetical protein